MRRDRNALSISLVGAFCLIQLGVLPLAAQQVKPPERPRPPEITRLPEQIWRSLTTGKEYSVRMNARTLYAEWVNIPPELAQRGAYIRSECPRLGTRWIGISRSYLPCDTMEGNKHVENWCNLLTKIEFDSITADRMTGRAEGLRRFDCERCKILETVWKDFEWVPKPETRTPKAAPRGKRGGETNRP